MLRSALATAVLAVLLSCGCDFQEMTKPLDNQFGDQHLKTAVALIELHKTRYGEYPKSLKDLKFTGQWDQIHIQSVSYRVNEDRSAYYLEVTRGWAGKPDFKLPDEFWRGTGYDPGLADIDVKRSQDKND